MLILGGGDLLAAVTLFGWLFVWHTKQKITPKKKCNEPE